MTCAWTETSSAETGALALAAAELVRVALEVRRIQADQREQVGDAVAPFRLRADRVNHQRLLDDRPCAHPWIE